MPCSFAQSPIQEAQDWTEIDDLLEQMVARGAIATDAELDVIYDYLVAQYGRVAINTATADEIAQVLHLEQGAADTIVQYRRKNGAFADFDALARVPELPVADLEKRRDAIVF
jgi:competence ComEA-like helix-hairpin-helix protein